MRRLIIAIALSFFAVMTLAGTATEPGTGPALATASYPAGDPVIVNMDTSKPFSRDQRDGIVTAPAARPYTDL